MSGHSRTSSSGHHSLRTHTLAQGWGDKATRRLLEGLTQHSTEGSRVLAVLHQVLAACRTATAGEHVVDSSHPAGQADGECMAPQVLPVLGRLKAFHGGIQQHGLQLKGPEVNEAKR